MKSVKNINFKNSNIRNCEQIDIRALKREAEQLVNEIFKSLIIHCPAWKQACHGERGLDDIKLCWTKAFERRFFDKKYINIEKGLLACADSANDFLPSVGRFLSYCDQNNEIEKMAQDAYERFSKAKSQTCNIGMKVLANHEYDIKKLSSDKSEKLFVSKYLKYYEMIEYKLLKKKKVKQIESKTQAQKDKEKRETEKMRAEKSKELLKRFRG